MGYLAEYGLFLAKSITIVLAIIGAVTGIVSITTRNRQSPTDHLNIKRINERYKEMADTMEFATLSPSEAKKFRKKSKKNRKAELKNKNYQDKKRLFVMDFDGDIRATDVELLREEITAITLSARKNDEVLIRLESAGGMVHAYGLAAAQILRLQEAGIYVSISVDKVAASGGYLMACVANHIIASPFAIIGSIGVVAEMPNFNRLLKKYDIDYEQISAGEYKRTISMLGETTDKAREKVKDEVEETHTLFKDFVKEKRPVIDLDTVATGEHWLGSKAFDLKLIDEISTSDAYLIKQKDSADIFEVEYVIKKKVLDRITNITGRALRIFS